MCKWKCELNLSMNQQDSVPDRRVSTEDYVTASFTSTKKTVKRCDLWIERPRKRPLELSNRQVYTTAYLSCGLSLTLHLEVI